MASWQHPERRDWLEPTSGLVALVGVQDAHPALIEGMPGLRFLSVPSVSAALFPKKKAHPPRASSYEGYEPAGVLKTSWLFKHRDQVPAAVLLLVEDTHRAEAARERELEWQAEHFVQSVAGLRAANAPRDDIRVAVAVLRADDAPRDEDVAVGRRYAAAARHAGLDPRDAVFVVRRAEAAAAAARMEPALKAAAADYYRAQCRRAKKVVDRVSKSSQPRLCCRHQFKIGFFAEAAGDPDSAARHYRSAYEFLRLVLMRTVDPLALVEIKTVAYLVCFRLVLLLLRSGRVDDALAQFDAHMGLYADVMRLPGLEFHHQAWLAKQYRTMGEALESVPPSRRPPNNGPGFFMLTAGVHAARRKAAALPAVARAREARPGRNPADAPDLQATTEFVGHLVQRRPAGIGAANALREQEEMLAALVDREAYADHTAAVIDLLTKAYEHFKQDRSNRMILHVAALMADEYYQAADFGMAKKFFDRIAKTYRKEGWRSVLAPIVTKAFQCARKLGQTRDVVAYPLELMGAEMPGEVRDKQKLHAGVATLLRRLQSEGGGADASKREALPPGVPPGVLGVFDAAPDAGLVACSGHFTVRRAARDAAAAAGRASAAAAAATARRGSSASLMDAAAAASAAAATREAEVGPGDEVRFHLLVTSHFPLPVHLDSVSAVFAGGAGLGACVESDGSALPSGDDDAVPAVAPGFGLRAPDVSEGGAEDVAGAAPFRYRMRAPAWFRHAHSREYVFRMRASEAGVARCEAVYLSVSATVDGTPRADGGGGVGPAGLLLRLPCAAPGDPRFRHGVAEPPSDPGAEAAEADEEWSRLRAAQLRVLPPRPESVVDASVVGPALAGAFVPVTVTVRPGGDAVAGARLWVDHSKRTRRASSVASRRGAASRAPSGFALPVGGHGREERGGGVDDDEDDEDDGGEFFEAAGEGQFRRIDTEAAPLWVLDVGDGYGDGGGGGGECRRVFFFRSATPGSVSVSLTLHLAGFAGAGAADAEVRASLAFRVVPPFRTRFSVFQETTPCAEPDDEAAAAAASGGGSAASVALAAGERFVLMAEVENTSKTDLVLHGVALALNSGAFRPVSGGGGAAARTDTEEEPEVAHELACPRGGPRGGPVTIRAGERYVAPFVAVPRDGCGDRPRLGALRVGWSAAPAGGAPDAPPPLLSRWQAEVPPHPVLARPVGVVFRYPPTCEISRTAVLEVEILNRTAASEEVEVFVSYPDASAEAAQTMTRTVSDASMAAKGQRGRSGHTPARELAAAAEVDTSNCPSAAAAAAVERRQARRRELQRDVPASAHLGGMCFAGPVHCSVRVAPRASRVVRFVLAPVTCGEVALPRVHLVSRHHQRPLVDPADLGTIYVHPRYASLQKRRDSVAVVGGGGGE